MQEKTVYVIDDEHVTLDLITTLLDSSGLNSKTFSSAIDFLDFHDLSLDGCVVLDINMPEMDGLELQKEMNKKGCKLPIIFITGFGSVVNAVEAMKEGAVDFLEKPYNGDELLKSIYAAFENGKTVTTSKLADKSMDEMLLSLTPRENEIMKLLANSVSNKEIARQLEISPRTVEVHRQHIMKKLKIKSVTELSQIIAK